MADLPSELNEAQARYEEQKELNNVMVNRILDNEMAREFPPVYVTGDENIPEMKTPPGFIMKTEEEIEAYKEQLIGLPSWMHPELIEKFKRGEIKTSQTLYAK